MLTRMEETYELVREVHKRARNQRTPKRAKNKKAAPLEEKSHVVNVDLKLNGLFGGMTINAFPKPPLGKVFTIPSDTTILDAVRQLVAKNFLSAPVEDISQPASADCLLRFPGLISLTDIVTFVTSPLASKQENQEDTIDTFLDFLEQSRNVESVTVGDIIESKKQRVKYAGLYPMFEEKTTFLDALTALGKFKQHRFVVFSTDRKKLVNIITQGAMCRLLQKKLKDEFEHETAFSKVLQDTTLRNVGLGKSSAFVISVVGSQPTLDAFVQLGRHQFGGLPIIEENQENDKPPKLLGNISARDIRSVLTNPQEKTRMFQPVSQFLEDLHGDRFQRPKDVISCKSDDSLASILEKVVGQNIHRVYLVDDELRLLRVVSLSDLLGIMIV